MKKVITFLLMILLLLGFASCTDEESDQAEIKAKNESIAAGAESVAQEAIEVIEENTSKDIIHNDCYTVIEENNLNLGLSEGTQYSFYIQWENEEGDIEESRVNFDDEDESSKSFSVDLPEDSDNNVVKEIIACAVATIGKTHDYKKAKETTRSLVGSYDGYEQSKKIGINGYKVYIKPPLDYMLCDPTLEVVYMKERNSNSIDITEYEDYTNDEMNAPFNEGQKAHIKGVVKSNTELSTSNVLEVTSSKGLFFVYYDSEKFVDMFKVEKQYDFYGVLREKRDGYDGCIYLDYFK